MNISKLSLLMLWINYCTIERLTCMYVQLKTLINSQHVLQAHEIDHRRFKVSPTLGVTLKIETPRTRSKSWTRSHHSS